MAVLIVDDSRVMRQVQRKVVRQLGDVRVVEAEDGVTALRRLKENDFEIDLILTDWKMPRLDGLELVKVLKGHPRLKKIPILMVTSNSEEKKMREALQAGVNGYLLKPFTEEMLVRALVSLSSRSTAPSLAAGVVEDEDLFDSIQLPTSVRRPLLDMAEMQDVSNGTEVLCEDAPVDHFFMVVSGRVRGHENEMTFGPGECFAVTELMTGDRARGNFQAIEPTRIGRVPRKTFESFLLKSGEISLALSRYLAERARSTELRSESMTSQSLAGTLEVLELPDLIQALNLRQSTGIIQLPDIDASIGLSSGQVVYVRHGGDLGESAFRRILELEPKGFRFDANTKPAQHNVERNTTRLLLDCMREIDESVWEGMVPAAVS